MGAPSAEAKTLLATLWWPPKDPNPGSSTNIRPVIDCRQVAFRATCQKLKPYAFLSGGARANDIALTEMSHRGRRLRGRRRYFRTNLCLRGQSIDRHSERPAIAHRYLDRANCPAGAYGREVRGSQTRVAAIRQLGLVASFSDAGGSQLCNRRLAQSHETGFTPVPLPSASSSV
jgi:hypothetical protein